MQIVYHCAVQYREGQKVNLTGCGGRGLYRVTNDDWVEMRARFVIKRIRGFQRRSRPRIPRIHARAQQCKFTCKLQSSERVCGGGGGGGVHGYCAPRALPFSLSLGCTVSICARGDSPNNCTKVVCMSGCRAQWEIHWIRWIYAGEFGDQGSPCAFGRSWKKCNGARLGRLYFYGGFCVGGDRCLFYLFYISDSLRPVE